MKMATFFLTQGQIEVVQVDDDTIRLRTIGRGCMQIPLTTPSNTLVRLVHPDKQGRA